MCLLLSDGTYFYDIVVVDLLRGLRRGTSQKCADAE